MKRRHAPWMGGRVDLGRCAALVALLVLLLGGAMPMPDAAMAGPDPLRAPICHGGVPDGPARPGPQPGHHDGMCPACCLFHCLHAHAAILTPAASMAPPGMTVRRLASALPQARAPPSRAHGAAYPRGPPTLA